MPDPLTAGRDRVGIDPQSVDAPLSTTAVFLVLAIEPGDAAADAVRGVIVDLKDLVKTVGFRDLDAKLSCIAGIGSTAWGRLTPVPAPRELHPFREIAGPVHTAVSTPGDLLFHIRANRRDLCFEFERLLLDSLAGAVRVVDEVNGFRYFDSRDLLGFVDGTANPAGADLPAATLVGDEDPDHGGGSYVVVQKYLHDLRRWQTLPTPAQEAVIGRTKLENLELPDAETGQKSHKTLATITDEDGSEHEILRDNMPFGRPGEGEFGTYFIGYSGRLSVIERMLRRMFVGEPEGLYDKILDVSTPATGTTFFAPSRAFLATLGE